MAPESLIEREVSRCNRNLLIFNIGLTLLASWVISWFFFDFELMGKVILIVILLSLPIYNYYKLYRRLENYKNHPIYQKLLRFDDPLIISERIEHDLKDNLLSRRGDYKITSNWIVFRNFLDFHAIHSTEICWVYLMQTQHSVNFIPTGSTYGVKVHPLNETALEIPCSGQDDAGKLIETLHSMSPWAIYGFSEEIKAMWERNPNVLLDEVNGRLMQFHKLLQKHGKRKKK